MTGTLRSVARGCLLGAAALVLFVPTGAAAADSPSEVLDAILAAARAGRGVHSEGVGNYESSRVTFISDAGVEEGIQRITYRKGGQTGHATVIVSGNTAYVRGDAFTLLNYLGFRRISAVNYSGRWVRFPGSDRGYPAIAAGVTLASLVEGLALNGKLSHVSGRTIDGRNVVGVRATASTSSGPIVDTVYARATGSPQPLKRVTKRGPRNVTTTHFSRWSGSVAVPVPKASTAIGVIRKAHLGAA